MRYLLSILAAALIAGTAAAQNTDDSQRGWLRHKVPGGSSTFTGDITLENDETISNSTDGSICFGADSGEDLCLDLDGTNLVDITTNTGVLLVDFGTINLATDGLDLSEGAITNVGDIALDSITADAISGGITMGGTGAASTESLLWKFGETGNQIDVSSLTGVARINWGSLDHIVGDLTLGGNLVLPAAGTIQFTGRSQIDDGGADHYLRFMNAAGQGIRLNLTTNSEMTLTDEVGGALHLKVDTLAATGTGNSSIAGSLILIGSTKQLRLEDNVILRLGLSAADDTRIEHDTAQTPNSAVWGVGTQSRAVIFMEGADVNTDFALPQQAAPTIDMQSLDATTISEGLLLSYAGAISRAGAAAADNHDLTYGTGTNTHTGDWKSGSMTYCQTGATTTDGLSGNCVASTGLAGAGQADAGDHIWNVHGAVEAMRITGATGALTLAQAPVFADYTRHHDVPIGAALVGAAAPGQETIGTFRCYVFDANADLAHVSVEVPSEWNGSSDMAIDLLIFTDNGDALGNGEVIEFDLVYRSVDEGQAYDNGAAVTIEATVTGGGAETDKGQYKISATVDYDDTDQPLAVNDTLGFSIMRDVDDSDTYSGDVHVCRAQLVYTANALATH